MTIDSSWLTAFKHETPDAYTKHAPFKFNAAFIDGQIRLMQGANKACQPWDQYIQNQFVRPLSRYLDVSDAVVLAFDNYEYVPVAKCMTQQARRRHVPVEPFGETSPLPCVVPEGPKWLQFVMNRTFKARVIELVALRLPAMLLANRPGKTLIIDYKDVVEYTCSEPGKIQGVELDMPPLGEADVKFTRYADRFQKLVVDSIDGDSVPIALSHHERCLSRGMAPPRMAVYRLVIRIESKETRMKRKLESHKNTREYEYLDITRLHEALRTAALQCVARVRIPGYEGHEVRMLVALIALTGTDFSRGLPQVSGAIVFDMLADVWMTLITAYDPHSGQLRREEGMRLVGMIYRSKFEKHIRAATDYPEVLATLRGSKLSDKLKERLASVARIDVTLRNVNWVLLYWTCEACGDPISEQFGYRLERPGAAQYADL